MGIVLTDLTIEDLCDLMCGGPEQEEEDTEEDELSREAGCIPQL